MSSGIRILTRILCILPLVLAAYGALRPALYFAGGQESQRPGRKFTQASNRERAVMSPKWRELRYIVESFAWEGDHCYVRQQPSGGAELARMVNAIAAADLRCIRYRGRDADVLRALRAIGELGQCDFADGAEKP
jgi:hypothetical protein